MSKKMYFRQRKAVKRRQKKKRKEKLANQIGLKYVVSRKNFRKRMSFLLVWNAKKGLYGRLV